MIFPSKGLRLNPAIELIESDDALYLIKNLVSGKFWKVDERLFRIMKELKEEQQRETFEESWVLSSFSDSLLSALISHGWLISEQEETACAKHHKAPDYLLFSFAILSERIVNSLASRLVFLFHPYLVASAFVLLLFCFSHYKTVMPQQFSIDLSGTFPFVIMMFFSVLFHELGHATALVKFGQPSGRIGGAFYLFSPVMFTDVTNAWALTKRERIVVNCGGMYFEAIFCAGFYSFLIPFGFSELRMISLLILLKTMWNLNPFLRSDGYWILSDLLNIPNLRSHSLKVWKVLVIKGFEWKQLPLLLYSSLSALVVFYFLYYTLILHSDLLVQLPFRVYHFLSNAETFNSMQLNWADFIPVVAGFLMYFMLVKALFKLIWKWSSRVARMLHSR